MRKRSHIWYKLYRTDDVDNLVSDFYSYAGINRASSFLLEGLKQRDAKVLRHFSRLPTLPPEQVCWNASCQACSALSMVGALRFVVAANECVVACAPGLPSFCSGCCPAVARVKTRCAALGARAFGVVVFGHSAVRPSVGCCA